MSHDRRRLVLAALVSALIVVVAWVLRSVGGDEEPVQTTEPPPPTAPADGFRWVGSGHVVVSVPDDWESQTSGCAEPSCPGGGGGSAQRPTVSIGFSVDDSVSPRDEAVLIDGTAAVRAPATCDVDGCTGRIVVPSEHVVVLVRGASAADVDELLDGVHVLDDRVAVPEFRYSEKPSGTDARRFREWAESLGLRVEYEPVDGEVPGRVVSVEPPTGSVVAVGTTVRAHVVGPIPAEPDCSDLRLVADGFQVYPFEGTVRVSLDPGEDLTWKATGACAEAVTLDDTNPVVPSWVVPFCSGLAESAAATCAGGTARIGAAVVTRR
ncbi:MAG TPA: PASTA domain-containing protein [Nocardioidaceae bacterium]|nr:PASTA domain-containing protein [Nocardioidaceae bacterium]